MMKKEDKFKLIVPTEKYKKKAIKYIKEHNKYHSEINGSGLLYMYLKDYNGWLNKLENDRNIRMTSTEVPSETFFMIRERDDKIIGMVNIRTKTNDRVKSSFGNIGYGIRPKERQKGYNKINLYLALLECQKYGLKKVVLSCTKDNIASEKTMKALGATFDKEVFDSSKNTLIEIYRIDVDYAINTYKDVYGKFISLN